MSVTVENLRVVREKLDNDNHIYFTTHLIRALTGRRAVKCSIILALVIGLCAAVSAQGGGLSIPKINIGLDSSKNPKDVAVTLQILFMMTILTLAPSILIMTTAFTRIIIVLSLLRSALGIPQVPPNQVLVGLALFMTFFIMRPTFDVINRDALTPYFANKITFQEGIDRGSKPLRSFMIRNSYSKDLNFFINLARLEKTPVSAEDVPLTVVIPAFVTSELKTAFTMGFYVFLPFLVIDMVVASTLMSMGMMMLPPTLIAMPAKLLLFVLADGWTLILGALVKGFR